MCNFINTLPSIAKSSDSARQKFTDLFLQPTKNDEYYRFRLIGFSTDQRDFPFIEKWVHNIFGEDDNGKYRLLDSVVCPTTRYVKALSEGVHQCPICSFTNKLWNTYKESGYKNTVIGKKQRELKRQFCANILVYVVNDPNYSNNNNKLKVITFNDKDEYKVFLDLVKRTQFKNCPFNAENAVDLWIKYGTVDIKWYEGTPKERVVHKKKITDMGFSTKPYSIPSITKELVDSFNFDENYFRFSSDDELNTFYKKHCILTSSPSDDIVINPKKQISEKAKTIAKTINTVVQPAKPVITEKDNSDIIQLMTDSIDDEDLQHIEQKTTPVETINFDTEQSSVDLSDEDLDKLLADDLPF